LAEGHSLNAICQQLLLDRGTLRRFARAASDEELLVKATNRTGMLDKYTEHLHTRFSAGSPRRAPCTPNYARSGSPAACRPSAAGCTRLRSRQPRYRRRQAPSRGA